MKTGLLIAVLLMIAAVSIIASDGGQCHGRSLLHCLIADASGPIGASRHGVNK